MTTKNVMFKKFHPQSGFTLIEVIIIISITAILMAAAIPAEVGYRRRAELKNNVKELRSLFWDAQSRTLAPRTKDITQYKISLIKQSGGPSPNTFFTEKECVSPNAPANCSEIGKVTLGQNVYIKDIKTYVGTTSTSRNDISIVFHVGDNKTTGMIDLWTGGGALISCDKMEIIVASSLFTDFEYKITFDMANNSINYEKN